MFFVEKGKGNPPFVLVHGTGGDHTHMAPQLDYFSKRYRTIALDLRGHGKSEKNESEYTIESFADDIFQFCKAQKIQQPVFVGFSMGGNIGIELASRHPGFLSALVILDSGFLYPETFLQTMQEYAQELKGSDSDFRSCIAKIVENGLLPKDRCKEYVKKSLLSSSQRVWSSAFDNMIEWDKNVASRLKKCKLPLLYIEAAHQLADMARFKELCPHLVHGKVVGSGHSLSLEVPEQVHPMIDRFMAIYL